MADVEVPVIPGWKARQIKDVGGLVAELIAPLTDYQLAHGCWMEIIADTPRELEWLCLAATAHAELVNRAQQARLAEQIYAPAG